MPPRYRQLKLCSGQGGFEALPEGPQTLDLKAVRDRLEREGIAVVDARVMLIAAMDPEVTISRGGRLLFKTQDANSAERAFDRLLPFLAFSASSGDARGRSG
jgi:hypothetical protein